MRDLAPLFAPFTVNGLTLPNRIVMAPMGRNFAADGVQPAAFADYYLRRVHGGVGLIVGEASRIDHPVSSSDVMHAAFHGEEALEAWRGIVDAVNGAGGLFMPQLWHAGLLRPPASDHPDIPNPHLDPVGPSGWAEPLVHTTGWVTPITEPAQIAPPMSESDIAEVIASFARAAAEAQAMGCAGINLHAAHGYLIDQFFWDGTNVRDDAFGGDMVNRTKFAAEVIRAVRSGVSRDFPVILRWSQWKQQDYNVKLAPTPQALEKFLDPLAKAGVDCFHCSTRRFWEPEFEGSDMNVAAWTKKITGLPTITVGSVGLSQEFIATYQGQSAGPASLDKLIELFDRGDFDLVAVGRALIVNPDWANKMKAGDFEGLKPFSLEALPVLH